MPENTPRRILVIDDNPAIHRDFVKVLSTTGTPPALQKLEDALFGAETAGSVPSYEIDSALQGQEGLEKLLRARDENRPYAVAFVDMRMPPGWDGVQTIRELWKSDPDLQVAICTAFSDYSPDQVAATLGVTDRLLILRKPFEAAEVRQLAAALSEKWLVRRQRLDLERMVEQRTAELQRASLHDTLTHLPNRLLFNDRLGQALRRAARQSDYRFAVLFVDCDKFKTVNDTLGHAVGDALLLEVAERLRSAVRDLDTVASAHDQPVAARMGGDEFAILLENIRSDSDAARVAERIILSLSRPCTVGEHEIKTSVSVGITTSSLGYQLPEDMIRDADLAMYRAKAEGGARFVVFDENMHHAAVQRLAAERELRKALAASQFMLHYQPIINIRSGSLEGFEALARWNHPTRGVVPPAEFIPLAEDTGVIIEFGLWALREACGQLARWQKRFPALAELTMSVNVSRKQLRRGDFPDQVRRVLQETGVQPRNLKLEITESGLMEDVSAAVALLKQIQASGVQLHMDDFGTGYSSLSCLQEFPLDGLKLDRAFIKGAATARNAVVRSVVSLAHNLQLPLVAEGIETHEQDRALQAIGCDHGQGFFYSRPMEPEAATRFIAQCIAATNAA